MSGKDRHRAQFRDADLPPMPARYWDLIGPGAVLVGLSIGAGETSCENRLLSTGYGSVASDPDSSNTYCYTYFEDCDPFGETAFVPQ